eukprot:scaffold87504_cov18-Tisochrysis_lutea.AAC.3
MHAYVRGPQGGWLSGFLARSAPYFRDRMMADKMFLFKVGVEVLIDSGGVPILVDKTLLWSRVRLLTLGLGGIYHLYGKDGGLGCYCQCKAMRAYVSPQHLDWGIVLGSTGRDRVMTRAGSAPIISTWIHRQLRFVRATHCVGGLLHSTLVLGIECNDGDGDLVLIILHVLPLLCHDPPPSLFQPSSIAGSARGSMPVGRLRNGGGGAQARRRLLERV